MISIVIGSAVALGGGAIMLRAADRQRPVGVVVGMFVLVFGAALLLAGVYGAA